MDQQRKRFPVVAMFVVTVILLCFTTAAINYTGTTSDVIGANDGYMKMTAPVFWTVIAAVAVIWTLYAIFFSRNFNYIDDRQSSDEYIPVFVWVILAVVIRMSLAVCSEGYIADVNCFQAWAIRFSETGPVRFYSNDYFCDYPPLYFYISYIPNLIVSKLSLYNSDIGNMIFRMPSIIADAGMAVLFYKRMKPIYGHFGAAVAASFILFNPMLIADSAVWGQVDSVFMLFMLLSLVFLEDDRLTLGGLFYMAGLLMKPQALLFGPALLIYAIHFIARKKKDAIKPILKMLAVVVPFVFIVVFPFSIGQEKGWLLSKYFGTMASYPYATLNALNVYSFLGFNMTGWTLVKLGLTLRQWGYIGIAVSCVLALAVYYKYRDREPLAIALAVLLYSLFMIGPAMHERYLVPAALLVLYIAWKRGKRVYALLGSGMSLVAFANMFGVLRVMHFDAGDPLMIVFSSVNIALYIFFLATVFRDRVEDAGMRPDIEKKSVKDRMSSFRNRVRQNAERRLFESPTPEKTDRWNRIDIVLIAVITLSYGAVGLTRLGDRVAPETYWEPEETGSTYVLDFGETKDFSHYNIFENIGDGTLLVEVSDDEWYWKTVGDEWKSIYSNFFSWDRVNVEFSGRYVRLTVNSAGFRIGEIGFFDGNDVLLTPTIKTEIDDANAIANAFDEQDIVPVRVTYMNGTYFDEVYHARTAYEELHGEKIYELTHPPLGKDIIMLGIKIFGMNPFGWRVMGAMAGVLMIPAIYVLGRLMFKRRRWAALAAILMSLDFMHYAQTRIATIDSFAVLFIILMYIFMFIWYKRDFYGDKPFKTLIPLGISGIMFGLGSSVKWIGIYAGFGLAAVFFYSLFKRFEEYRAAKALLAECDKVECTEIEGSDGESIEAIAPNEHTDDEFSFDTDVLPEAPSKKGELSDDERERLSKITLLFKKRTITTLLWCVLFFAIVPCLIYCLSYIPYIGTPGQEGGLLDIVVRNQEYMFSYHSKYVLESQTSPHPYQSRWYTWPFIGRPIFFFMGQDLPSGVAEGLSSFGNPAIWWFGIFAFAYVAALSVMKRGGGSLEEAGGQDANDTRVFLIVALLAEILPWTLVTRSTYIYHYFATTPFLILCVTSFFRDRFEGDKKPVWKWALLGLYVVLCVVLFILYYPLITGTPISAALAEKLRILPGWVLYGYWL